MKKIILIVAVVLVAVVGLTSFNGKEAPKQNGDRLVADVRTTQQGDPVIVIGGGGKKTN
jgi:hypothetical protein